MQITRFRISIHNMLQKTSLKLAQLTAILALSFGQAYADNAVFDQPDTNFTGRVMSAGVVHPGETAQLRGMGFKPGQEVQLLRNGKVISGDKAIVVGKDGNFEVDATIPKDAALGLHPIVVQVGKPSAASVFELRVSKKVDNFGEDKYEISSIPVAKGLYQSAYSPKSKALYLTSSVGRPPVTETEVIKVDPESMKVVARITPEPVDAKKADGQRFAAYGVAVDDNNGYVWVTNSRSGTLTVYKQDDLSLVKQFPTGIVPSIRDVVIDSSTNRAYTSGPGNDEITVIDTKTLELLEPIKLKSEGRTAPGSISLALDEDAQKLYSVSIRTNDAHIVDLKTQQQEKVITLPGAQGTSGVAVAPKENLLWVAAQNSDNVYIIDLKSGEILHEVRVSAGPLNVLWDEQSKLAYVTNRASGQVSVLNPKGELVASVDGARHPNHMSLDQQGNLYLVHKSTKDGQPDELTRIHVK